MRQPSRAGFGTICGERSFWTAASALFYALLLLALASIAGEAQQAPVAAQSAPAAPAAPSHPPNAMQKAQGAKQAQEATQPTLVRSSDRRRAAKLFLAASKLFEKGQFEEAMHGYQKAALLDPDNGDYSLSVSVARSHAVTALVQAAAKDRVRGDEAAARKALSHGLELEPQNSLVDEHINELGDDALLGQKRPLYEQGAKTVGEAAVLAPARSVHSFHLHSDARQVIQQVFKAYGIDTSIDSSLHTSMVKIDLDDVDFETATHIVGLLTASFYVPLDSRHVLVARDTKEQRDQFMRQDFETIYLPGLTDKDLTDVSTLAKNVFDIQQATTEATTNTITIRAPQRTLDAFNETLRLLLDGHSQVMLEVRVFQVAHTSTRDTGAQLPQQVGAYNIYTEEESILNSNSAAIQQIISSGLAKATDTAAILGILIAAGDVSSSLFSNGIATFGNGKTLTGISPGSITANFNLNSTETRELDDLHTRLGDGEATTIKSGTKYPIQTSQYSSAGVSSSTIAGLTSAGSSSTLSSLLASYSSSSSNIPMVEYQDLGLTLKATPKVLRTDDVALTIDMKIDALSGSSINGNPVLNNRAYTGVVTVKAGETMELVSELTKTESRAVSGTPGLSEIPGLSSLAGDDKQKDYSTLLILITPHVIRSPQAAGHSPMMRVETKQAGR